MAKADILLIESDRASAPSYASALEKKGFHVSVHHSVVSALAASEKNEPDLLILDAASMRTSGTRMSAKIRSQLNGVPLILISPPGSSPDTSCGASLTIAHPFTTRKLVNRVESLLPGDESHVLQIGPIRLNLAQRTVRCHGKETRLTPKQVELLELFMKNAGRLLTRKRLIRQVWETDYMGDTRTLDVHMSWLRRAIELDPKQPRLLKTIRSIGYRLDLP